MNAVIKVVTCNLLQWNTAYSEPMQCEPDYRYLPALPLHFYCNYLQCTHKRIQGSNPGCEVKM